jgi:hypothetical protein
VTPRGLEVLLQKGSPAPRLLQQPQLLLSLSILTYYSIHMISHGTLCTVALHPLIPSIDSHITVSTIQTLPLSLPTSGSARRRAPIPAFHPTTVRVFSDDADVGRDIAHTSCIPTDLSPPHNRFHVLHHMLQAVGSNNKRHNDPSVRTHPGVPFIPVRRAWRFERRAINGSCPSDQISRSAACQCREP